MHGAHGPLLGRLLKGQSTNAIWRNGEFGEGGLIKRSGKHEETIGETR